MELHEYQAKELLQKHAIPIPAFFVASSLDEVKSILKKENLSDMVLKVQIHAGGRGKAGGVVRGNTEEEILRIASELLGMKITNEQTGPYGMVSHKILLTVPVDIAKEFYVSVTVDRKNSRFLLIVGKEGGVNVEAQGSPMLQEEIWKEKPIPKDTLERIFIYLSCKETQKKEIVQIMEGLRQAFFAFDATLIEINPLVETSTGQILALDAKMTIDDDALFRHLDIAAAYDFTQLTDLEVQAKKNKLAYIRLDGHIACMVNGAGLSMATIDLLTELGGKASNFLDVGGLSTPDKIEEGLKILFEDENAKVIFINIFGGIVDCVDIGKVIIHAIETLKPQVPFVIRLQGNKHEEAKAVFKNLSIPLRVVDSLTEGARAAIDFAKGAV